MKLHFLGTCAGTEPMPGRKHASVAVEVGDRLYWFDAGEGCSYTAHLMGLDLLKIKAVFISHLYALSEKFSVKAGDLDGSCFITSRKLLHRHGSAAL